jgi:hypothetical protein
VAKASFRLANGADLGTRAVFSVEVDQPVDDQWLLDMQEYFATHLPPDLGWPSVHKFAMQVSEDRELDPNA